MNFVALVTGSSSKLNYLTSCHEQSKYSKSTPNTLCQRLHYISSQCIDSSDGFTSFYQLTHWGRVTHICVGKLTIIVSDKGLSPARRQAIIWTSAGILLIGSLGTNFSEILIEIQTFTFKKMRLKISSAKWRPCVKESGERGPRHTKIPSGPNIKMSWHGNIFRITPVGPKWAPFWPHEPCYQGSATQSQCVKYYGRHLLVHYIV